MDGRKPIDILLDKADFRCTICNAKMGECDCWEEAIFFDGKPPYHREGLPGLTFCMQYPWTRVKEIGGAIRHINVATTPKRWLCPDCYYEELKPKRVKKK